MLKVSDLTKGEKLQVMRRRDGLTMPEAAAEFGVGLAKYRAWERDERDDVPNTPLGKLDPIEAAYVYRRRSDMNFTETADEIGVSRWWLRRMERGDAPPDRLLEYWGI